VHAHERALCRPARSAIASLSSLRSLTLITSPDFPASFAAGLLVLTRLRQLSVLRVGLGFGAVDALLRLRASVARALPRCQFEMLSDVDGLPEEHGPDAGLAPDPDFAAASGAGDFLSPSEGAKDGDDDAGPAGSSGAAAAARARGPRYVRLMRSSWGG
jgi:hypothetical protein